MNKTDWIDYFEALNGRTPTELEIAQAMVNGEIQTASEAVEEPVVAQASEAKAPEVEAQREVPQQASVSEFKETSAPPQQSAPKPVIPPVATQYVEQTIAASPAFFKQFWSWLMGAVKAPMTPMPSHKYNGIATIAFLTLGYTIIFFTLAHRLAGYGLDSFDNVMGYFDSSAPAMNNPIGLKAFFMILLGVGLYIFSIVFAGFVVKRFIYQESDFTFAKSFEWYGRLFATNVLLVIAAALFTLFGLYSLTGLLLTLATLIFGSAMTFALSRIERPAKTDDFHRFLLGMLVNAVILFFFLYIEMTLIAEYLRPILDSLSPF